MPTNSPFITVGPVSPQLAEAVRDLAAKCESHDGVAAISEQPLLQLSDRAAQVAHSFVIRDNALVGYAQIDLGVPGLATAEIAVAPKSRGTGIGRRILNACMSAAEENDAKLAVWAYGNSSAARHLLEAAGLNLTRELLRLEVPLGPSRVEREVSAKEQEAIEKIRTFRPGKDDAAWLETNAQAFSWHPEQGRLTQRDLSARMAEPWFDPETFLVIDGEQGMSAYSWLKIVPGSSTGEIYVVGVSPSAQGKGLGRALIRQSLRLMQERELSSADLYVDADNGAALAMYLAQGFAVAERHGQYSTT